MKISALTFCVCLFSLLAFLAISEENPKVTNLYFLTVEATNAHTRILVNDVPLVDLKGGTGTNTEKPVANWLMPGTNTLTIEVDALPGQETINGNVNASIFLHDSSAEVPTPKKIYTNLSFPGENTDLSAATQAVEKTFKFEGNPNARLWQEAEPVLSISAQDKKDILALVDRLEQALVNSNNDEAVTLQQYKISEDARIEGHLPDEIKEATKNTYRWLSQQNGLFLIPFDKADTVFTSVSKNTLVKVSKPSGDAIVQLKSDALFFEVPVYVAKISGSWIIAR